MAWKIYCLEGEWFDTPNNSAVRDLLAVLTRNDRVQSIQRDVETPDDLIQYLNRWTHRRYRDFRIGYLAFHGHPGRLRFCRAQVPIGTIAEQARGSCKDKIVFFGSCSVAADRHELARFKKHSGASAVCGYTREADWTPSAAFDVLLLHALAYYKSVPKAERWVRKTAEGLCDHVGFAVL